jgi:hypothetical protein
MRWILVAVLIVACTGCATLKQPQYKWGLEKPQIHAEQTRTWWNSLW